MSMRRWVTGVLAVLLFAPAGFCAVKMPAETPNKQPAGIGDEPQDRAERMANLRQVSGEIAAVDLKEGRMTLREITPGRDDTRTNVYEINGRDTAVTDPLDKQFLKIEDLLPGHLVRVEYAQVDGRRLARTITVESGTPMRWAVGQVSAVDATQGTLTLTHMRPEWVSPVITYYRANPKDTRVVDLQGQRFISLQDLRLGDTVQVEFTLQNGERFARWIGVEAPRVAVLWSSGRIESIDPGAGTLVISERIPSWNFSEKVYYVVDLNGIRVVDLRDRSFLQLSDLRPGDPVSVQFIDSKGKRSAQTVVLIPTEDGGMKPWWNGSR